MIAAILGTTYTGQYEDVEGLNNELEKKNAETGWDIHIHVDAASGGFVAPFVVPDMVRTAVHISVLMRVLKKTLEMGFSGPSCVLHQRVWAQVRSHLRKCSMLMIKWRFLTRKI